MADETSSEWFQLMCESSPDFMVVIDRNRRFRWVNRLHPGLAPDDVIGMPLEKYEHPDTHALSRAATERAFETGVPQSFHSHAVMPDGSDAWYQVRCIPVAGHRDRLLLVTTDVTERRSAERERDALQQQLFRSQKMDALGRLAGGVAHDFNNLLTPIMGSAELAMRQLAPEHPMHGLIADIHQAATRAAALTGQLLTISKGGPQHARCVDLARVVTDLYGVLRRVMPESIRLEVSGEEGRALAWADQSQVEQVLLNLMVNARDAMPDGGTLHVRTFRSGERAVLEVQDSGLGIDQSIQSRIFDPFFSTKGELGTGLGLSVVHGIVEQAAGTVEVESRPGEGSTFRVALPLHSPRANLADEPDPESVTRREAQALEGAHVLVVEDEPLVCELVVRELERAGCAVMSATDVKTALKLCASALKLDLLVCDVVMPDRNGPEVAQHVLVRHPDARVLFMSGYAVGVLNEGDLQSARLLQKPFSLEQLVSEATASLRGRTPGA